METEVLNIYPVKETKPFLTLVIPECYVKVVKTKKEETLLKVVDPRIINYIKEYFNNKGFLVGHESFYSDSVWVFPKHYSVEQTKVLPEKSGLIKITISLPVVIDFENHTKMVDFLLPWEDTYIVARIDGELMFTK